MSIRKWKQKVEASRAKKALQEMKSRSFHQYSKTALGRRLSLGSDPSAAYNRWLASDEVTPTQTEILSKMFPEVYKPSG